MDYRTFAGSRIRLQRLSDRRFFGGWVESFESDRLAVVLDGADDAFPGDRLYAEAHGTDQRVSFTARVSEVRAAESKWILEATSAMSSMDATETARKRLAPAEIEVESGSTKAFGIVVDGSTGGLGAEVDRSFERKDPVDVRLPLSAGGLVVKATIRYCRPLPGKKGKFRIGVAFDSNPDNESGLSGWRRMLEAA